MNVDNKKDIYEFLNKKYEMISEKWEDERRMKKKGFVNVQDLTLETNSYQVKYAKVKISRNKFINLIKDKIEYIMNNTEEDKLHKRLKGTLLKGYHFKLYDIIGTKTIIDCQYDNLYIIIDHDKFVNKVACDNKVVMTLNKKYTVSINKCEKEFIDWIEDFNLIWNIEKLYLL